MAVSSYETDPRGDSRPAGIPAPLGPDWSVTERIAFRFAFPFLLLLTLPFPLGSLPGRLLPFPAYDRMWRELARSVGSHLLHLPLPPPGFPDSPLSDTSTGYAGLVCYLGVSVLVALLWTLFDRKHAEYRAFHEYLRIYVRYMLAFTMLSYGMDKVLALQFNWSLPGPGRLAEPLGNYSPFALLWTFMGYSSLYTRFAGIGEVLGGLLLFFRRTTTLGALILCGVMANVVMLNFSYGVPVKLFSSVLLLLAVFLVAPETERLLNVFVRNRPAPAVSSRLPFRQGWTRIARWAEPALVLFSLYWFTGPAMSAVRERGNRPRSPVYGLYQVEAFMQDGKPAPPDDASWRRLIFEGRQEMTVIAMDDSLHYFPVEYDDSSPTVTLSGEYDPDTGEFDRNRKDVLSYSRPDPGRVELRGNLGRQQVVIQLRKVDLSKFTLLSRKFHWIENGGYYR